MEIESNKRFVKRKDSFHSKIHNFIETKEILNKNQRKIFRLILKPRALNNLKVNEVYIFHRKQIKFKPKAK